MPLCGRLVCCQCRRIDRQRTLQLESAALAERPVFAQPQFDILHREIALVMGVNTSPRCDTDGSVQTDVVREMMGVTDWSYELFLAVLIFV